MIWQRAQNKKIPALLLALCFTLTGAGQVGAGQMNDNKQMATLSLLSRSQSKEMVKDGADFLKEMANAADNLTSYSFESSMTVFKGSKTLEENSRFYFKKPRQLRAEELGPYKKGSVAVLLANGKVKGHLGGLMSKFVATVEPTSEWVRSANGYPLIDSDFYGMSQVMINFVKEGKKALVTETPVSVTGQPQSVYVLELYKDATRDELMKRAYINPQTLLPVEWFDYKDKKLFAHTRWKNVQLNKELASSLFDL